MNLKCFTRFILVSIVLSLSNMVWAVETSKSFPYAPGEMITYDIKKLRLTVGQATLIFNGPTKIDGKDAILITFTAKAPHFFDEEKIYLDTNTLFPMIVERDFQLFRIKEKIKEEYSSGVVKITKTTATAETSEQIVRKSGLLDNVYGFIYRYRKNGNFHLGETASMNLPTQDVKVTLLNKENLKVGKKNYDSFYIEGQPKNFKIWFDSSLNKIPLKIEGALRFGKTILLLKNYEQ